ncbi:hypothetical protein THAOC_22421, partial [Thalassiosira oceanica]
DSEFNGSVGQSAIALLTTQIKWR